MFEILICIDVVLLDSLMIKVFEFGVILLGGVDCLVLIDDYKCVCDWFVVEMMVCGYIVLVDVIGNLFGWIDFVGLDVLLVMIGLYLDSQFLGGWFDGVYGVMVVFVVIEMFCVEGKVSCNYVIVDWMNEEGVCF